ncbi:recombinase family protein [Cytobacillus gottheilii]|uniref:recombinase family protein n=1 Tax=Cytobacillus gottheilii TaxID=859144 RepID=UPI0024943F02|nr:recombinase family protein [Cytobacillus gottheilii]
MNKVAMYLRKSRADVEAESRGEGETLAKHKKTLLKVASELQLNIIKIYEEIVSGESLMHRPAMLQLLNEVEANKYDAVICMDMDRLGRGGMKEQGLILETFKEANTKIITPRKTYDLHDEWDEEYSEFEAFMARKELKIITRRLQRGRLASVEAGNYIGTTAPYGYKIKPLKDGRSLEPHEEQSAVVKMIFDWYTHDDPEVRIGAAMIANKLNELGYKTAKGNKWSNSSVLSVIKNAVYAGRIQWGKTKTTKSTDPHKTKEIATKPKEQWIDVEGKHEPIITMELFQKAQEVLKGRYHVPYQLVNGITNPLAGIVVCDKCGAKMVYRPYTTQKPHIKCYNNPRCDNKASNFELIERRIIESLEQWLEAYKADWEMKVNEENDELQLAEVNRTALIKLERELVETEKQQHKLHDLLERGIYTENVFLERSRHLSQRAEEINAAIESAKESLSLEEERQQAKQKIIPQVEHVLDLYYKSDDPKRKNSLLKSVLEKAVYRKEKHQWRDDFQLVLYPKLNQ